MAKFTTLSKFNQLTSSEPLRAIFDWLSAWAEPWASQAEPWHHYRAAPGYCTNSINSSHLVTCDRHDEILVLSHHWGRCDHQKNSSKCKNAVGRHRVSPLSVDSWKYFIKLLNFKVATPILLWPGGFVSGPCDLWPLGISSISGPPVTRDRRIDWISTVWVLVELCA